MDSCSFSFINILNCCGTSSPNDRWVERVYFCRLPIVYISLCIMCASQKLGAHTHSHCNDMTIEPTLIITVVMIFSISIFHVLVGYNEIGIPHTYRETVHSMHMAVNTIKIARWIASEHNDYFFAQLLWKSTHSSHRMKFVWWFFFCWFDLFNVYCKKSHLVYAGVLELGCNGHNTIVITRLLSSVAFWSNASTHRGVTTFDEFRIQRYDQFDSWCCSTW